ncbi:MAG: YggT family protein [Parachlamydiales bacterium]
MIRKIISIVFFVYILMIIIRVVLSWFPKTEGSAFARILGVATDPYLNLFRSFIPTVGGIDFSPAVALLVLLFARWLILRLLSV